jgi:SepF-like predicted cell division protein (DUF552 family)
VNYIALKRNIALKLRVSEEEHQHILKKMRLSSLKNIQNYLLKMAVDGYILNADLSLLEEIMRLLAINSNNINQMARKINSGLSVYRQDVEDIKRRNDQLWDFAADILKKFDTTF